MGKIVNNPFVLTPVVISFSDSIRKSTAFLSKLEELIKKDEYFFQYEVPFFVNYDGDVRNFSNKYEVRFYYGNLEENYDIAEYVALKKGTGIEGSVIDLLKSWLEANKGKILEDQKNNAFALEKLSKDGSYMAQKFLLNYFNRNKRARNMNKSSYRHCVHSLSFKGNAAAMRYYHHALRNGYFGSRKKNKALMKKTGLLWREAGLPRDF